MGFRIFLKGKSPVVVDSVSDAEKVAGKKIVIPKDDLESNTVQQPKTVIQSSQPSKQEAVKAPTAGTKDPPSVEVTITEDDLLKSLPKEDKSSNKD